MLEKEPVKEEVYIGYAKRTPIGCFLGALSDVPAYKLSSAVIQELLREASPSILPSDISDVLLGQVFTSGCGVNPARQASLNAGLPDEIASSTVGMVCGSGMKAIVHGAHAILAKDTSVVIAGGMENMSLSPHLICLRGSAKSAKCDVILPNLPKFGDISLVDSIICDSLEDPTIRCKMGDTAEVVAHRYGISRHEQDLYALRSHQRSVAASKSGRFRQEIVPVDNIDNDEQPRSDLNIEKLAKLKPCFEMPKAFQGSADYRPSITPANCSSLNDGAAAVILVSKSFIESKASRCLPLARFISSAQSGSKPELFSVEPVSAVRKALAKAGWSIDDVDLWEINEAFACSTLAVIRDLKIDQWEQKVNVNGGAIAMGHPFGATGARLVVTLAHELARKQNEDRSRTFRGVATTCIGGGQALAVCLQSVQDL